MGIITVNMFGLYLSEDMIKTQGVNLRSTFPPMSIDAPDVNTMNAFFPKKIQ